MRNFLADSARSLVLGLPAAGVLALGGCGFLPPNEIDPMPPEDDTQPEEVPVTTTAGNPPDMIKTTFSAAVALPSVVSIVPSENATSVSTGTNIQASYDGSMPPDAADIDVFVASSGARITGSTTYDPNTNTIVFDPHAALPANTKFRVDAPSHSWFFTTGG